MFYLHQNFDSDEFKKHDWCTGEKNRRNKTRDFFLKIGPLRKFGVLPS
jgi:hypothetical protein